MSRKADVLEAAGLRYWREADARVMVEAWRSSGETLSEFAECHRVDPKRIARWASRLGGAEPEAVRFHPVRLAEGPESRSGAAIEIHLVGGRRVRLASGFETEDLRRVLAVLEGAAQC